MSWCRSNLKVEKWFCSHSRDFNCLIKETTAVQSCIYLEVKRSYSKRLILIVVG